ncbi:hypothetical protein D3C76_1630090 [compost metagenome]|uniref:Uncharacterized protein n=1 Tax=Pseudomonas fluorescens TaxID=294 RepID=A0A5E7QIS4_PSEFL|nr:hypothetical protein PS880_06323 [Pseudomonas fluorescens]
MGQGRCADNLAVIGFQDRVDLDHAFFISFGKAHDPGLVGVAVKQQIVIGQIVDGLRRALALQVTW